MIFLPPMLHNPPRSEKTRKHIRKANIPDDPRPLKTLIRADRGKAATSQAAEKRDIAPGLGGAALRMLRKNSNFSSNGKGATSVVPEVAEMCPRFSARGVLSCILD